MASDQYRVLVVDDEPAIRQLSANALRNQGFECDLANDGEQAAQMAASSRYDVVVTDLKMPNRNGHAFATEILRQPNRPLVVVHTGVMEPKLANDLLLRGVDDLIFKPTDFRVLATKVKSLVERAVRSNDEKANSARQSPEPLQHVVVDEEAADRPVSLSQLNHKLAEISTVLPVSNAALDVYEMTHGDNWEIPQIAAAIQRDASLTTEVLRLANSSFYNASGRRIICLEEALLRIGQQRIGELALSANVLAALTPDLLPWMDLELTWKRSIAAGIAIESLIERGGHEAIEEGLLLSAIMHPLGRVVLGILFPNHYGTMTEQCKRTGEPLREQERQMFPTNHPEIMAHLLASWRISSDVFAPLKYSMDDFSVLGRLSEPLRTKTELVKVAIVLGRLAVGRWETWDLVELPSPRLLKRLRVANVGRIIEQCRSDLSKLASFHPGGREPRPRSAEPAAERTVPFCNLSENGDDLLAELLPSMGLKPKQCSTGKLQHLDDVAIINCLSAAIGRFASPGGWNRSVIIADQENREIFEPFAETATLPDSYGHLRDLLLNAVTGHPDSRRQELAGAS